MVGLFYGIGAANGQNPLHWRNHYQIDIGGLNL
jgi:hypothetical protein